MVIISMMLVLCSDIAITEYGRRRSGLYNTPLDMEYGNKITEESTAISLKMNIDCQSSDRSDNHTNIINKQIYVRGVRDVLVCVSAFPRPIMYISK